MAEAMESFMVSDKPTYDCIELVPDSVTWCKVFDVQSISSAPA